MPTRLLKLDCGDEDFVARGRLSRATAMGIYRDEQRGNQWRRYS